MDKGHISWQHTSFIRPPDGLYRTISNEDGKFSFEPIFLDSTGQIYILAEAESFYDREFVYTGVDVYYKPSFGLELFPRSVEPISTPKIRQWHGHPA